MNGRMAKLYEIRNLKGQFMGTYYAKNAKAALARAEKELNAGANAFRKSWTRISLTGCSAVEINPSDE